MDGYTLPPLPVPEDHLAPRKHPLLHPIPPPAHQPVRAEAPHSEADPRCADIERIRLLCLVTRASYIKRRRSSASLCRQRHPRLHALPHSPPRRCVPLAPIAAEDGTTFWTKIVGVDTVRASDCVLFRCCSEAGWKSCEPRRDGESSGFLLSFGLCVGN
jgi:hypothetical protein